MNYSDSSHILLKADNCFYAVLDNMLYLKTANETFKNFFSKKYKKSELFINLFNTDFKQQLKEVFNKLQIEKAGIETITIPEETEQEIIHVQWNISPLLTEKNEIESFEILGVISLKPMHADSAITNPLQDYTENALEKFFSAAAHDLKQPLRMITSFLQLLERKYGDKLDGKAHEYISHAVNGTERMKKLISDLQEYAFLYTNKPEEENINLNDVIENIKLTYRKALHESQGTISYEQLPLVKGTKNEIVQLFKNIIDNALQYTSGKPPVIHIACKETGCLYEFAVKDNGIGIGAEFFEEIFIAFRRLHSREEYPGTGMGLAICKKITDKHKGNIWLTSAPDNGSTFYFTLSKSEREPAAKTPVHSVDVNIAGNSQLN